MENEQHTPEPWKKQGLTIWSVNSVGLEVIANTTTANGDEKDAANARRIVACVNACEGISTEALEVGNGIVAAWNEKNDEVVKTLSEVSRLRAENERLREIIESALTHQIANRGTDSAFYKCYTYSGNKMPDWVYRAEAALSDTAQPGQ